jgi:hypothetical protein
VARKRRCGEFDLAALSVHGRRSAYRRRWDFRTRDDNKGGNRDATIDETVRAATMAQKVARDPVEGYRQQLQKNGKSLKGLLDEVAEFDTISARDPVAGIRHIANKFGLNPQAVAQHLFNGTSPLGDAKAAERDHANRTIAEFDARHNDPMSKQLRPLAAKILERGDKRLAGLQFIRRNPRSCFCLGLERSSTE